MRNLFILLICTLAVTGFAANPAYTDFRGTNEVLVTTNPATGRIIIGPATPISTQISAAQLWTNVLEDFGSGEALVPLTANKDVAIGAFGYAPIGDHRPRLTVVQTNHAINDTFFAPGSLIFDDGPGVVGTHSSYQFYSPSFSTNFGEGVGVIGQCAGSKVVTGYGVIGIANTWFDGATNVGVAGVGILYGSVDTNSGGYFATADDDSIFPSHQSAALVAESLGVPKPMFCAGTNGHYLFWIYPDHTTNATSLDVNGLTTLYGGVYAKSNSAPIATVAPANLHSVTLGKGWTNDLGARADLVISVKYTDAATGDPSFSFTNSITGEAWTNSVAFGLTATTKDTVVIPDISPSDRGSFTDLSGTGSSVQFLQAWWKLK